MFIVIEEEEEEACRDRIVNETKNLELLYCQHIVQNNYYEQPHLVPDL